MPGKQLFRRVNRFVKHTAALTAEDRARAVRSACDVAIKTGQIAAGIFASGQSQSAIGNSRGLFAAYRETHAEFSITMQENPAASWAKANSADVRALDPQKLAGRASEKAHLGVNAHELPTGRYTVILEPAAVLDLVGFLFYDFAATALEDKRSCLNDRMGKPLFGPNISISDDVYHPLQQGAPFDGEGVPTRRTVVIENGVLKSYLLNTYTAKKLGLQTTGNASRGLAGTPGIGPGNYFLEPGKKTPKEIVAGISEGLYVTEFLGHGANLVTGDYSRGASGLWISGGELTYPVEEITVAGNLLEMFRAIEGVGNDLVFRDRTAAPTVLIGKMVVAGA